MNFHSTTASFTVSAELWALLSLANLPTDSAFGACPRECGGCFCSSAHCFATGGPRWRMCILVSFVLSDKEQAATQRRRTPCAVGAKERCSGQFTVSARREVQPEQVPLLTECQIVTVGVEQRATKDARLQFNPVIANADVFLPRSYRV